MKKMKIKNAEIIDKNYSLFNLMCIWHRNILEGKNIHDYLMEKGYEKVVIYGMGAIGTLLLQELNQSGVCVSYSIDQNAPMIYSCYVDVILPSDVKKRDERIDIVIITAVGAYEQVKSCLDIYYDCPIVYFEDLLLDL